MEATQPFTQAIEQSSLPLLTQPNESLPPLASAPVIPADQQLPPPVPAAPAPAPPPGEPVPAVPRTGLDAALHMAQTRESAALWHDPPPYVQGELTATATAGPSTGVAVLSRPRQIMTDQELAAMDPDTRRETLKHRKVTEAQLLPEEEVQKYDTATLRRMGLGRTPSGYCYSTRMTLHTTLDAATKDKDDPHPERPERISGIHDRLKIAGLVNRMERIAVREVVRDEVMLVHSAGHWDHVRATQYQSIEFLTSCTEYFDRLSLYVNPDTAMCARLSCGGVIEMCRAVAEGQIRNGFAIVRPPGHHAEPEDAMGFCFFNNVAVAAKWLRTIYDGEQKGASGQTVTKMNKILILDWDVHHGNGTQKAFWDDPNVLYISLHRHGDGFYPGGNYGSLEMVGEGAGAGFSVNVPFTDTGMGDADYIYAFQQVIMPIAYEFAPDMVLVSAGYDAAEGDKLGQMKVSPEGFAHMTHMLSVLANGKLVLALEGGYNVDSIVKSAHACVEVLVGDEPRYLKLESASMSATNVVQEVIKVQSKYWKCMGFAAEGAEELKSAGKIIPVTELLKAHRVYDLYHEYELFNVEFTDPVLEESYGNQLLVSPNVYECETLLIFMHDIGSIKSSFTAATLDVEMEKTLLLDTSRAVLDWAMKDHDWGVIDINLLAHLPSVKGQPADKNRDLAREKVLSTFIWDNIARLSSAQNIILFGSGAGCAALMEIIRTRADIRDRVRACISVLGLEPPPELDAASGQRSWYKEHSLVMLPSTHPLQEDARRAGKTQKKYGNVYRSVAEDEGRPIHLLQASLPRIRTFVEDKLPAPRKSQMDVDKDTSAASANGGDVEMKSSDIVV